RRSCSTSRMRGGSEPGSVVCLLLKQLADAGHAAAALDERASHPRQQLAWRLLGHAAEPAYLLDPDAERERELCLGAQEQVRRALEIEPCHHHPPCSVAISRSCSTIRQRSWTTRMPARASSSAAASLRIPSWNQTAYGFFARMSGTCGGMSCGFRNTSTMSTGSGMSATRR